MRKTSLTRSHGHKYEIASPEAWVWRIAHNRYARYVRRRKEALAHTVDYEQWEGFEPEDGGDFVSELISRDEYEWIFRALHTLSCDYRRLTIDYYLGGEPVKSLAAKYSLSETAVKWRMNVSREKIRERKDNMNRIYNRINWNTRCCNGSFDPGAYLNSQLSRAICLAAYERPLTAEEISVATGIPALYIEDELPRLEYGDAIARVGSKWAADFIILRRSDRSELMHILKPYIGGIADHFERLLESEGGKAAKLGFYGAGSGMERLGYIAVPHAMRAAIGRAMSLAGLNRGEYPPRRDGGYGWYIVSETEDEYERTAHSTGCNAVGGSRMTLYYYHIGKYFDDCLYQGIRELAKADIVSRCADGRIADGLIGEDALARYVGSRLVVRDGGEFRLGFPVFTARQFENFTRLFDGGTELEPIFAELLPDLRAKFARFVPARLDAQINQ